MSNHKAHWPLSTCKISGRSYDQFLRNLRKTLFLVILGPFSADLGRIRIFFKNQASSLSSLYRSTPSCKKSEKTNERIQRKMVTHGRTDGQGWIYRTLTAKSRGSKNVTCQPKLMLSKFTVFRWGFLDNRVDPHIWLDGRKDIQSVKSTRSCYIQTQSSHPTHDIMDQRV